MCVNGASILACSNFRLSKKGTIKLSKRKEEK